MTNTTNAEPNTKTDQYTIKANAAIANLLENLYHIDNHNEMITVAKTAIKMINGFIELEELIRRN